MHARRINCKANASPIQNDGNSWSSEKLTHDVYQNNLALPRASYRNNARSFFAHPPPGCGENQGITDRSNPENIHHTFYGAQRTHAGEYVHWHCKVSAGQVKDEI